MKTYQFWVSQSSRWSKTVDYASPMSAWTGLMFDILDQCNGDKMEATKRLREIKK